MKKILFGMVGGLLVLLVGFFALNSYIYKEKQGAGLPTEYTEVLFTISGEPIELRGGTAEAVTDLGGTSPTTVRYFGNEVVHDIDGDGDGDTVFLITQETADGNVYFYAVGALAHEGGYNGTQAVLLGDRIAPQTTEAGEGRIILVNYADRAPGEPMTAQPSVGKTLHLLLDTETMQFGEVVQNFEGESR